MNGVRVTCDFLRAEGHTLLRSLLLPFVLLSLVTVTVGCATAPQQTESIDFRERATTETQGDVSVRALPP